MVHSCYKFGWGTGYHSNTVTSLFTQGDDASVDLMALRERYRLGRSRSNQSAPYDSREFPKNAPHFISWTEPGRTTRLGQKYRQ